MTDPADPTHGHTPPEPVDDIAEGVGRQLAQWTIEAMGGAADEPADLTEAERRSFRRVLVTVDALKDAASTGTGPEDGR